jgi:hypothetical protein
MNSARDLPGVRPGVDFDGPRLHLKAPRLKTGQ